MRRGDIILTSGRGDFSTKPRPSLVVQGDLFNDAHPAIVVCPITTRTSGDHLYRIPIAATAATGLFHDSEIEVDLIQAVRRERTRETIGAATHETMTLVDDALRRWLDL